MELLRQAIADFVERNENAVVIASVSTFDDNLDVDEGYDWFIGHEAVLRTAYECYGEALEAELKERAESGNEEESEED